MNLSQLYSSYNILSDAKDKVAEHVKEYQDAIEATRGGEKEKQLAAQIISKFFKHFPELQNSAIEAVFDLCEDDDTAIRIAAMKTLPSFCKDGSKYVARVADITAQLLQLEDPQEYNIASGTLLQIFKEDPISVIRSMFKLINDKTDGTLREKCLKFILTKVKVVDKALITVEVEDLLVSEIKNMMRDCNAEEFVQLMTYLVSSKYANSFTAQQELIDIAAVQADVDQAFIPLDGDNNNVDRVITCVKFIIPFFSIKVESTKFVTFYCDQVLPQWDLIADMENGKQYQIVIGQQLAEMSQYCGALETPSTQIVQVFDKLKVYMPQPPEDTSVTMPQFNFTIVECLLYAFHRLARQSPDFLTCDPVVLKDFRSRLMYLARAAHGCLKVLNLSDKEKIFSPEEKKIREISPRILNNINALIKDLFYQPPIYKCNVALSFKTEEKKAKEVLKVDRTEKPEVGTKRHVPIYYESNGSTSNKQGRQVARTGSNEKKIYTPPSGKFSHNFHNNDRTNRYRGRGGSSRGQRGRGRGGYRN